MSVHYQPGTYRCTVISQGLRDGEYGTHFFLEVQPEGGQYTRPVFMGLTKPDGSPDDYAEETVEKLIFLGFDCIDFARLEPGHPNEVSFVGQQVECYCSVKTKDGKEKDRWYLNIPSALSGKPAESNSVRRLNSLFGKAAKGRPAAKPQARPQPPQEAAQAAGGDDTIPF